MSEDKTLRLGGVREETKDRVAAGNPHRDNGGRDTEVRASAKKTRRSKLDFVDELYVDPKEIPDGFCVEWKRNAIHGKVDNEHHLGLEMDGWEYAQPKQFPSRVGKHFTGDKVLYKDLILMIRPKELTDEAKLEDKTNAKNQVKTKMAELGLAGQGEAQRVDGYGRSMANVKISYDKIQVE